MSGKFPIILAALFLTAVLAFSSLQAEFGGRGTESQRPTDVQRPSEPVRSAHGHVASSRPRIEQAAVVADKNQELAELTARIQELQHQLEQLKRSAGASAGDDASASMPMPESEEEERQRTRQITTFLHNRFVAETKDPVWSLQAERQVSETFNLEEISQGSELRQLSCRTTLCRIEARHHDSIAEHKFLMQLSSLESFGDMESFSERFEQPDGSVEVVTYVSRSGQTLPRMEPPG